MELDELKTAWEQYDRKLTQSLKVNEALLTRVNRNTSRLELQKPLLHEVGNGIAMFLWAVMAMAFSIRYIAELKYSVPGFFAAALGLICFVLALIKINSLMNIDFYGSSIVKLQRETALANQLVLRFRRYELVLGLFAGVALLPLMFKVLHQTDLYTQSRLFLFLIIMVVAIGISYALWANKQVYDIKFRNSERLLDEISQYETENKA
jgi:hypothetical protein